MSSVFTKYREQERVDILLTNGSSFSIKAEDNAYEVITCNGLVKESGRFNVVIEGNSVKVEIYNKGVKETYAFKLCNQSLVGDELMLTDYDDGELEISIDHTCTYDEYLLFKLLCMLSWRYYG